MTVKPETDQIRHLKQFREMYGSESDLLVLTDTSNTAPNLVQMMRNYKVPIGMTEEEQEEAMKIFKRKQKEKKWY